jgi:regulator of replication initiation timing
MNTYTPKMNNALKIKDLESKIKDIKYKIKDLESKNKELAYENEVLKKSIDNNDEHCNIITDQEK